MKYIDAHIHIADLAETTDIIVKTIYKDKYRLYSEVSLEMIKTTHEYLQQLDRYYAIPIIFKETNIIDANKKVKQFCDNNPRAVFVPLIEYNINATFNYNSKIYKEHFLSHNYEEWQQRTMYYEFMNINSYSLIIHCKDRIRLQYIRMLREKYRNIQIIIPHMGRDVYENYQFSKNVIDFFKKDDKVSFDTSTIADNNILIYALKNVGCDRILFGSDFPLGFSIIPNVEGLMSKFYRMNLKDNEIEKIFFLNAYKRF
jgi:hypothetical protein